MLKAGVAESRRASRESISRESLDSEGNVSSATSGAPLGASSSTPRTPSRRQQQQQQRADDASAPEPHIRDYDWYALELYAGNASDSDGSASDDSEGEEEEDVTPKKATSLSLPARRTTKGKTKKPARQKSITAQHVRPQPPFSNPIPADLSTLDYLLRLAALESREQLPLWDIADEKISFALAGDEKKLAASAMSGEDDREGDRRSIAATAEEERAVAESPLARKALPSSTSRRRSTLHK